QRVRSNPSRRVQEGPEGLDRPRPSPARVYDLHGRRRGPQRLRPRRDRRIRLGPDPRPGARQRPAGDTAPPLRSRPLATDLQIPGPRSTPNEHHPQIKRCRSTAGVSLIVDAPWCKSAAVAKSKRRSAKKLAHVRLTLASPSVHASNGLRSWIIRRRRITTGASTGDRSWTPPVGSPAADWPSAPSSRRYGPVPPGASGRRRRHTRVPPALWIGSRPAFRFRFRSMWGPWISD